MWMNDTWQSIFITQGNIFWFDMYLNICAMLWRWQWTRSVDRWHVACRVARPFLMLGYHLPLWRLSWSCRDEQPRHIIKTHRYYVSHSRHPPRTWWHHHLHPHESINCTLSWCMCWTCRLWNSERYNQMVGQLPGALHGSLWWPPSCACNNTWQRCIGLGHQCKASR